jgi:hypothetical protein
MLIDDANKTMPTDDANRRRQQTMLIDDANNKTMSMPNKRCQPPIYALGRCISFQSALNCLSIFSATSSSSSRRNAKKMPGEDCASSFSLRISDDAVFFFVYSITN